MVFGFWFLVFGFWKVWDMTSYENLNVWKKSMALVVEVYKVAKQ